jgi:hypothetical protein
MPADIRGGVSRRYRLPDPTGEAAAAEQLLAQRTIPGEKRPLPPPAPLPPHLLPGAEAEDDSPLGGVGSPQAPQPGLVTGPLRAQQLMAGLKMRRVAPPTAADSGADLPMADAPEPDDTAVVEIYGVVAMREAGIEVALSVRRTDDGPWSGKYTGEGISVTEALSIAAGALEEGLQQPVCPHCGQVMPTEGE